MAVKASCEIVFYRVVDIDKVTRYYILQSSTSSAPSKPTANPPGGNWKTTEPSYTSGSTNTLYFVDLTVMTNGTYRYSEVSKSSSYEAAKEAYNLANTANNTANGLKTRVDDAYTEIESNKTEISLKASQTEVATLSNNLNAYIDSSTTMIQNINGWQFNFSKLIRTNEADVANHTDYITLQNGDIILGESASDLKLKIGNDAIQFKGTSDEEVTPDPDATAWITGQKFNINEGEIHTTLKVGNLQFTPSPNGNFSIKDSVRPSAIIKRVILPSAMPVMDIGADGKTVTFFGTSPSSATKETLRIGEVASFGEEVVLGNVGDRYTKIGSSGLSIYDGVNHLIGQIGYGNAKNKNGDIVEDCFYTLGSRKSGTTIGTFSVAAGSVVEASGHASFAEGFQTKATGLNSHAEGSDTKASGNYSHAEGADTTAAGLDSHAEGYHTTASGDISHAEGYYTIASGYVSHAGGYYTKASGNYQTVVGEYNIEDTTSEYLFIVGNGTADNARENALGVTHTGHIDVQKNIYINTNGSGIFERDTDGTNRELIAMDGNNKLSIGHGQYSHGGRETVLQGGDKLTFQLKNPNATWRPYMSKGYSFNTTIQVGGYITNSGKDVTFQLPLNNPVIGNPTVTIASVDGLCVRQNNKYLYGSTASTFAKPHSYSCTLVNDGNHIRIIAKMANTTNVENNSACGIYARIKVTFS